MKKIEKYVSRDGSEFSTEAGAIHREQLLDQLDSIESILPNRPDDVSFGNGHGYIQHDYKIVLRARERFYELACQEISSLKKYTIDSYMFGRYLSDSNTPLYRLYSRIVLCINDNLWREYGQPYFAFNPEAVRENIQVNK